MVVLTILDHFGPVHFLTVPRPRPIKSCNPIGGTPSSAAWFWPTGNFLIVPIFFPMIIWLYFFWLFLFLGQTHRTRKLPKSAGDTWELSLNKLGVQSSAFCLSTFLFFSFFLGFGPPKLPKIAWNCRKRWLEIAKNIAKNIAWNHLKRAQANSWIFIWKGPNSLHKKGWAFADIKPFGERPHATSVRTHFPKSQSPSLSMSWLSAKSALAAPSQLLDNRLGKSELQTSLPGALCREFRDFMRILVTFLEKSTKIQHQSHKRPKHLNHRGFLSIFPNEIKGMSSEFAWTLETPYRANTMHPEKKSPTETTLSLLFCLDVSLGTPWVLNRFLCRRMSLAVAVRRGFCDLLCLLQGSFGRFGPKAEKIRKWIPGPLGPRGRKSPQRSRKESKATIFWTFSKT